MNRLTLILILLTTTIYGQVDHKQDVFIKRTNKEYRQHFSPPKDIESAISQMNTYFTEAGRNYFKSLPEEMAMLQFGERFLDLQFTWNLHKIDPATPSFRKTNGALNDIFIAEGASGDNDETIRLLVACLHSQLNGKIYTVSELYKLYGDSSFKALQYAIRDVNPRDTVSGSWFNAEKLVNRFIWSTWFKVVSKDGVTDSLRVKILRIEKNHENVDRVMLSNKVWAVGDTLNFKNRELRNWKETIKL